MRLTLIGTGYVGLVAGAGFAEFGNDVICVDINEERIASLQSGEIPIYEPGLEDLVKRNVDGGRLHFSTSTLDSVARAEVIFIAVGTPSGEDGSADLEYVLAAAEAIARGLTGPCIVATKSTVPIGTGNKIEAVMRKHCEHPVVVVSNPEFLKEGDALNDFMKPSRVIIGCHDENAAQTLGRLYAPFVRTNNRVMLMDRHSAEMTKYAANAMLATRISFMNELSHLASAVGADIEAVRRGLGSDPRIGNKFLFAGAGYGGSCFPKDVRALLRSADQHDVPLDIVAAAQHANERQKRTIPQRVLATFGDSLSGKRIALWGLAFKPHTDDVRESAAIFAARMLAEAGATLVVYDPQAMHTAREDLGSLVLYAGDMYEATKSADALILATEWPCFRRPDFEQIREMMRGTHLFDGRNIWDPEDLRRSGFKYFGIGRRTVLAQRD